MKGIHIKTIDLFEHHIPRTEIVTILTYEVSDLAADRVLLVSRQSSRPPKFAVKLGSRRELTVAD